MQCHCDYYRMNSKKRLTLALIHNEKNPIGDKNKCNTKNRNMQTLVNNAKLLGLNEL